MKLVTDASSWVGLVAADEDARHALAVADALTLGSAHVPGIFWFEIRHVLLRGERPGKVARSGTEKLLGLLTRLGLQAEHQPPERETLRLARKHNLSVYDASYLELASRTGATLATLDLRLKRAAAFESVRCFEASTGPQT